ncbi:MAG: hypothetical protein AVDCRST_MAG45-1939 [uncultured Solirubrobacterales bacterium]|uniref:Uncharacterized protein n=1 Tax=uncultured Solirubrobacterales bacterium TaxID=768556 RepID=A0A6J4T275_9ACTN|nr:MAG: hypothetical protein AVDCRST_MAG45-1939 [uncultured Solirubrobacterales bacterium]
MGTLVRIYDVSESVHRTLKARAAARARGRLPFPRPGGSPSR